MFCGKRKALTDLFLEILKSRNNMGIDRSSRPQVFCKRVFLEISQIHTKAQVFFCEFWEISKNTLFYRAPLVTASEQMEMLK